MKKTLLRIILMAFGACMVSCNGDLPVDPGSTPGRREIRFAISAENSDGIPTRATATAFETGDSIGIYIVKRNDNELPGLPIPENNYAHNVKWIKTAEGWEPATMKDKLNYPEDGGKLDFYAYYPYDAEAINPLELIFTVKSDQSSYEDFTTSDLMLAMNTTGMDDGAVTLVFTHQLAWVEVEMKGEVLTGISPEVLLVGLLPEVVVDFSHEMDLQATGMVQSIKMNQITPGVNIYRALIPTQTVTAGLPLFRCIVDGVTYRHNAGEAIILHRMEKTRFEITLK